MGDRGPRYRPPPNCASGSLSWPLTLPHTTQIPEHLVDAAEEKEDVNMDDLELSAVGDRHLNLFCTYDTHHIENNVTRALMITLRNLAPAHLRLFLRDVVLAKQKLRAQRIDLLADGHFEFDLQVGQSPSDEDRLSAETGVIVGINFSGRQSPAFDPIARTSGGARPDALFTDPTNNLTVIFETKLSDGLHCAQIERQFNSFFSQEANLYDVWVEISWTEIASFLHRIAKQSVSSRERFITKEFVRYLDYLRLVDFIEFHVSDFAEPPNGEPNRWKLNRSLIRMADSVGSELGLCEYRNDWKLFFSDLGNEHENVWVGIFEWGVSCGIICGAGKKGRAQQIRNFIEMHPNTFKQQLDILRQSLDNEFTIALPIHSYFSRSRFQTAWLGYIGGKAYSYPDEYDALVSTLLDKRRNSFKRLSKEEILNRFSSDIENNHAKVDEGVRKTV